MKLPPDLRTFIDESGWRLANTHPEGRLHEYLAREHVNRALFVSLVGHIREKGEQRRIFGKVIPCFEEDEKVYWTMGASIETTTIINRCTKEQYEDFSQVREQAPLFTDYPDSIGSGIGHEQMLSEWFPYDVGWLQIICALRFTGYEYEEQKLAVEKPSLMMVDCVREVVRSLTLFDDPLKSFAAFFALQRFLFKWGGERLTKYSREHMAFDFLFLHLYRVPVPDEFANRHYLAEWGKFPTEQIESAAAHVRRSFVRIGNGPLLE